MRSPARIVAVVLGALVLMVGGAVVYAAIPSANGTITACMVKSSGTIRLIDTAKTTTCKTGEQKVTWNQAGQPGTDGTDGVSGYQIVSRQGSLTGGSLVGTSGLVLGCPAGTVALGSFGDAHLVRAPLNLPIDVSGTFLSGDDEGNAEVSFRINKLDGTPFIATDVVEYIVQITCAVMAS